MSMTHYRPALGSRKEGYYQGYYCGQCGDGGHSMYNTRFHGPGRCAPYPELVATLNELNTTEAENKREFTRKLKGQPSWTR